jgi:type IV pilus assembly protein PilA
MKKNKGFTLIELMVVILIVAILAAVLAPMLTGRIHQAKWTEGKAGAGTIATAIRAFCAENEGLTSGGSTLVAGGSDFSLIGVTDADLAGKYFSASNYVLTAVGYSAATGPTYTITVTAPASIGDGGDEWALDNTGAWTYTDN